MGCSVGLHKSQTHYSWNSLEMWISSSTFAEFGWRRTWFLQFSNGTLFRKNEEFCWYWRMLCLVTFSFRLFKFDEENPENNDKSKGKDLSFHTPKSIWGWKLECYAPFPPHKWCGFHQHFHWLHVGILIVDPHQCMNIISS